MQAVKQVLSLTDCFKSGIKRMVPELAEISDFEADFKRNLECPVCHTQNADGLFYRLTSNSDWILVKLQCSRCNDQKAFEEYQMMSMDSLKNSINDRLTKEYFNLSETLKEAGFRNFKETHKVTAAAKAKAISYAKDFLVSNMYNLLVMGNPGTGKSHLCVAIARTVQANGFSVGYLTSGELLSMIKATYKKGASKTEREILQDIKRLDCLVLDDLGSEAIGGNNDWRMSTIFDIVESRSGKPTIYTSNLTDEALAIAVGKRVFSRLYDNTKFIDMFIENYDYRKTLQRK